MATAYTSANRATWQLLRMRNINPGAGSTQTQGKAGFLPIARWQGAWMPYTGFVRDLPGAPIVDIDRYAFLPPEAAGIVREGDKLRQLETNWVWIVQKVQSYPTTCMCALKSDTSWPVDG